LSASFSNEPVSSSTSKSGLPVSLHVSSSKLPLKPFCSYEYTNGLILELFVVARIMVGFFILYDFW